MTFYRLYLQVNGLPVHRGVLITNDVQYVRENSVYMYFAWDYRNLLSIAEPPDMAANDVEMFASLTFQCFLVIVDINIE